MTFLRKEGRIQPEGLPGKRQYQVEFEHVMRVEGRNLRCEARWPIGEGAHAQGKGQTCIAAAFVSDVKLMRLTFKFGKARTIHYFAFSVISHSLSTLFGSLLSGKVTLFRIVIVVAISG
jgi:hypothetical protein